MTGDEALRALDRMLGTVADSETINASLLRDIIRAALAQSAPQPESAGGEKWNEVTISAEHYDRLMARSQWITDHAKPALTSVIRCGDCPECLKISDDALAAMPQDPHGGVR